MSWGVGTLTFLACGRVGAALEFAGILPEMWGALLATGDKQHSGGSHCLCYWFALPLLRLGVRRPVAEVWQAPEFQWDGRVLQEAVVTNAAWSSLCPEAYLRLSVNLTGFLADPRRGVAPETVRAALAPRGEVLAATPRLQFRVAYGLALLELCALAAEAAEDDELASFYAEKALERYTCWPVSCGSCLALLGRVALRRGDRRAALGRWRQAAAQVLQARDPLLVLRIAEDWRRPRAAAAASAAGGGPGEEGAAAEEEEAAEVARLVTEACAVCGRPEKELLLEFEAARRAPAVGATPAPGGGAEPGNPNSS